MIWLDSCGSTNAELLGRDAPHGTGLAAREQTGGRGRLGRPWSMGEGNLAMSVLLRPRVDPQQIPLITLGAGVVLAELTGFRLKWPNDLLDPQGRKLAGILAEANWERGALERVVVGIGVNLANAPWPGSACLADHGVHVDLERFAEQVRQGLADLDVSTVRERWLQVSCTLGRPVSIGGVEGTAVDLAENGALIVNDGERLHTVITGDLGFTDETLDRAGRSE